MTTENASAVAAVPAMTPSVVFGAQASAGSGDADLSASSVYRLTVAQYHVMGQAGLFDNDKVALRELLASPNGEG